MGFKSTFNPSRINKTIEEKANKSLQVALKDGVVDLQRRLDSGTSIDGKKYQYSNGDKNRANKGTLQGYAKRKGKVAPVDWNLSGKLRRSIDSVVKKLQNKIQGKIGYKDLARDGTSNKVILESLIKKYPKMWALSKSEIKELINTFKREFKR